ncbi:MAG: RsmD family RNA methyltransferase [Bacteroidetes bacterium]|nr:RsmD family RNA methyltransferase [Bacteroidota bacterium]
MRIISGSRKGLLLHPPKGLPVRPTTDRAKESLFNILENKYEWEGLKVLDLFAGTGNMSFEFASRGCEEIWSIDLHKKCIDYIKITADKLAFDFIHTITSDVFKFLKNEPLQKFDIIFADPPYDIPNLDVLTELIIQKQLIAKGGMYILEHRSSFKPKYENYILDKRVYGQSTFTFYGIDLV